MLQNNQNLNKQRERAS